jgi:hypothetical protein
MLAAKLLSVPETIAGPSVVFKNVQSRQVTTNSTAITITKPTGTIYGDLLVAFVCSQNASSIDNIWTGPAGWTEVNDIGNRGVFWKVAGLAEPANYIFTTSNNSPIYGFIAGFGNAAFDTASTWSAATAVYPQTIPGITVSNRSYVLFACTQTFYPSITYTISTSGWTSFIADNDTTGPSSTWWSKQDVVGSTGDVVVTGSGATARINRSIFISVKPAVQPLPPISVGGTTFLVNQVSDAARTLTLLGESLNAGDMLVAMTANRTAVAPALLAGYTSITVFEGSTRATRVQYKIYTSGSETINWTGAYGYLLALHDATSIGQAQAGSTATGTTVPLPDLTGLDTTGRGMIIAGSYVVGYTAVTAPYTFIVSGTTNMVAHLPSNTLSSLTGETITQAGTFGSSYAIEFLP